MNPLSDYCYREAGGGTPDYDPDRHRELMIETGYWTPPERPTPERPPVPDVFLEAWETE